MGKAKKVYQNHIRKVVRQLHLYLGLISGLVVFIVAVTGCCWVFQEEITAFFSPNPTVEPKNQPMLLPTQAREIAERMLPGRHIHGALYSGADQPLEVIFYEMDPEFYQAVFLDPYSGEVLKVDDYLSGFFPFVLKGHLYLWLPEKIGTQIVSWSTVVFIIMLISGIILWWPKNKKNRKQRFRFDWKSSTSWKRKKYDLHAVVGFYASFVAMIMAFTGLVMAFDRLGQFIYETVGGEKSVVFTVPNNATGAVADTGAVAPIDQLMLKLVKEYPHAKSMEYHYPSTDSSSIYVEMAYEEGVLYSSDFRFYDQNTLEEVATPSVYGAYDKAGFSEKVIRMNYDIHVGAIAGPPGKILAFFASLIIASLPITGLMVWIGRKKKKWTLKQTQISKERIQLSQKKSKSLVYPLKEPEKIFD